MSYDIDELGTLLTYTEEGTATQRVIEALIANPTLSNGEVAELLDTSRDAVRKAVRRARRRRAKYDPKAHEQGAPEGNRLALVTTHTKGGKVVQQWSRTVPELQKPEMLIDLFKEAVEEKGIVAADPVWPSPEEKRDDLLTIYPMGDPHLGMLAWGEEAGEDYDLDKATMHLFAAVDRLVDLAPPSTVAMLINLGDFFHSDNMSARTARSGHSLDVDTRWGKILQVGIACMVRCIDRALEKHDIVRVVNEIGNHDDHSSIMLSICLSHHYRNEPRVQVDVSPAAFHWYEHGKCLIGVTHGHTAKADKLGPIMANDQAEAWGRTKFRYWYTGHVHHESKKEYPGVIVETFRTLSAKDAWHSAEGYRSGRSMVCDVLHVDRGRIMRHEVGIESL